MQLFHGSISRYPQGALAHFGTLTAALHRLDNIFVDKGLSLWNGEHFVVCDEMLNPIRVESPVQRVESFAELMARARVYGADITIKNPFRLNDCWDSDPIGSGAMELFNGIAMPAEQRTELEKLFMPFHRLITPEEAMLRLSDGEFKKMRNAVMANNHFRDELAKRKKRLHPERWKVDENLETVWTYYTMRLRLWAQQKGYDSFVYRSIGEGDFDDVYVTFRSDQARHQYTLVFDGDTYLKEMTANNAAALIAGFTQAKNQDGRVASKLFWGASPERFWLPEMAGVLSVAKPAPRLET